MTGTIFTDHDVPINLAFERECNAINDEESFLIVDAFVAGLEAPLVVRRQETWLKMARFAGLRRPGGGLGRDDELVRFTVAEEGSQLACWCGWSIGFLAVLWALREGYDRTSALATAGPLQLPWDHDNRGPALARRAPEYIRRWKADEVFHRAAVSVWHLCSGDREINTPAFLAALEEL